MIGQHPWDGIDEAELRARGTRKWAGLPPGVLSAWVAEMDFGVPRVVASAVADAMARGATGYPSEPLDTGLPAALSGWFAGHGLVADPAAVRIVPDVLRGLMSAVEATVPAGSPVVLPTPAYPPFFAALAEVGRPVVQVPLIRSGGRYTHDLAAIDDAFAAGARGLVLCNPHNPVGRVFSAAELADLAGVVDARGARVIADEVHGPLVHAGHRYQPYAAVDARTRRHSVTLTAASKGWNVPGLCCAAVLLTASEDVAGYDALPELRGHGVSPLGIAAATAAFTAGGEWLTGALDYLAGNRELLGAALADGLPGIEGDLPEGTYLAWLDCRGTGLADPAGFLLDRARVVVNDGRTFGDAGAGHVRLNLATPRPILVRVLAAMHRALDGLAG